MKKILAVGLLAICAIACTQQQASAWVNTRLGVGLNWEYQSGGNVFGWGAWRNGQPGGQDHYGHHKQQQMYGAPGFYPAPMPIPVPAPGGAAPAPGQSIMAPYPYGPMLMPPAVQGMAYPQMPYQFATYPRPVYYYYPAYYGQ